MMCSPRERRYRMREQLILQHARRIAESEGWAAATTRRLAQEIDHSQPVVYQHFLSREHMIRAVVRQGFAELTGLIRETTNTTEGVLESLCWAYLNFGRQHPALYEAMFTKPTELPFAQETTPAELRESFEALTDAITREAGLPGEGDTAAITELFWATCHGLTSLHLAGRIPEPHLQGQVGRICSMIRD